LNVVRRIVLVPRQFSIDIDEPCGLGGSNRFANPQEHLLAELNACKVGLCPLLSIATDCDG